MPRDAGEPPRDEPQGSARPRPLTPSRDSEATLSRLLDTLLTKGVYLDLDAIITVAEVPLIGISLRAALAGMETLLEYGMMDDWDERTRAWARRSLPAGLVLGEHEEVVTRMPGSSFRNEPPNGFWQPGTVYLTTQRLIVYRREPAALLSEAPLGRISHVGIVSERTVGGEAASRLVVRTDDGGSARLTAARPDQLRELLEQTRGAHAGESGRAQGRPTNGSPTDGTPTEITPAEGTATPVPNRTDTTVGEGELWFAEARAGGEAWRRGTGRCDRSAGFTWRGDGDRRPAVRLPPSDILAVRGGNGQDASDVPEGLQPLEVETRSEVVRLATAQPDQWLGWLRQLTPEEVDHEHTQNR